MNAPATFPIGITPGFGMRDYHAMNEGKTRGDRDWVISRSDLKEIGQNPEFWKLGGNEPSSESLKIGSLVDALTTDPESIFEQFEFIEADRYPPKYREKEQALGKYLVKPGDLKKCKLMAGRLRSKRISEWKMDVAEVFDETCQFQVLAQTTFTAWEVTVPLRILIDVVPHGNFLADVKTTRSLDSRSWYWALRGDLAYAMQAAFYLDVFNAASEGRPLTDDSKLFEGRSDFVHFIVGNQAPYQAAVRAVDSGFIIQGRIQYMRALERYCQALLNNHWEGYPDNIEVFSFDEQPK